MSNDPNPHEHTGAPEGATPDAVGSPPSAEDSGYGNEYHRENEEYWRQHDQGWPGGSSPGWGEPEERLIDVKVLLEHLERFRWFVIRSAAVLAVAMVACLVAGNRVVQVLRWPLVQAQNRLAASGPALHLRLSSNQVRRLSVADPRASALWSYLLQTNADVTLTLGAVEMGTNRVLGFSQHPGRPASEAAAGLVALNNYGPAGPFLVAFQLAFYGGLVLASPFVFYFLGQFLVPFLARAAGVVEFLRLWTALAVGLFLSGVLFCYFLLLPVSVYGSVGFAQWMNFGSNEWRAEEYIGFICKFTLAMGLGFELPLVILALVKVGVLNHAKLTKLRAYWVVLDCVVSAMLTPDGSPLTMMLMAAPLWVLYEVSVLVVWSWERKERKLAAAGGQPE